MAIAQRRPAWSYKRKTTCYVCGGPRTSPKQRQCRDCHREYMRRLRAKRRAEDAKVLLAIKRGMK